VLGEVQAKATGAEALLEKVRNDLYTAGVAVQRTRAVNTCQDSEEREAVPVRVLPVAQPPP
jgi:type IV pilus biogenesis protein CpaD/CtpE